MLSVQCMQSSVSLVFSHSKVGQMGLAWQLAKVGSLVLFGLSSLPSCCPETKICKNHGGAELEPLLAHLLGGTKIRSRGTPVELAVFGGDTIAQIKTKVFFYTGCLPVAPARLQAAGPALPKDGGEYPWSPKNNPKVCLRWGYTYLKKPKVFGNLGRKKPIAAIAWVGHCQNLQICPRKKIPTFPTSTSIPKPRKYTPESLPQRHPNFLGFFGEGQVFSADILVQSEVTTLDQIPSIKEETVNKDWQQNFLLEAWNIHFKMVILCYFHWMIPNLYMGNGWKSPNIHLKMVVWSSRWIIYPYI